MNIKLFNTLPLFFIGFFTISLISCDNTPKKKPVIHFSACDTVIIEDVLNGLPFPQYYFEKKTGDEYLVFSNKNPDKLSFYNLSSGILKKNLPLRKKLWGFCVSSLDSIFLLERTETNDTIIMIDSSGARLSSWGIENQSYYFSSYYTNPLIYLNNKILIGNYRKTKALLDNETISTFFDAACGRMVNISNRSSSQVKFGFWPSAYRLGQDFQDYDPIWTVNEKGTIILSFSIVDSLYIYEPPYATCKKFYSKSKFSSPAHPLPLDSLFNYSYISKYCSVEFKYNRFIYDQYRKFYYRIVLHSQEYESTDGTFNKWDDKAWSIMVYDTNFSLLDEIEFPAKKYDVRNLFVSKKGLLISANHPQNPLFSHNKTSYILFNILHYENN